MTGDTSRNKSRDQELDASYINIYIIWTEYNAKQINKLDQSFISMRGLAWLDMRSIAQRRKTWESLEASSVFGWQTSVLVVTAPG